MKWFRRWRRRRAQALPDVGPYWPAMQGFDYRYGFPLRPEAAEYVASCGEVERERLLALLEAAALAALVHCDVDALP